MYRLAVQRRCTAAVKHSVIDMDDAFTYLYDQISHFSCGNKILQEACGSGVLITCERIKAGRIVLAVPQQPIGRVIARGLIWRVV